MALCDCVQPRPGKVTIFFGEEELNAILQEFSESLVIIEASMTWCRPCKGFERAYEVGGPAPPGFAGRMHRSLLTELPC